MGRPMSSLADKLGLAIVGCGLIGQKRARIAAPGLVRVCVDPDLARAERLAKECGAVACREWQTAVTRDDVRAVVVSTPNDRLAEIALGAISAGKHVLVEKPAARNSAELAPVCAAARQAGCLVRVGFNHRYHPALRKAQELSKAGALGELMFVRGRYGHGGRMGYEREWRADPAISGGGKLIDQGVHLIDLARLFLGDFPNVTGEAHTYYWPMPVDDNAFMILRTAERKTAFLHVSCTEWKNLFSFEIYGRTGKLHVEGLGGSYGVERLSYYRMLPEMGPPETTIWEYPQGDRSWADEFEEFADDIRLGRQPAANLDDALAALRVVERVYAASNLGFGNSGVK